MRLEGSIIKIFVVFCLVFSSAFVSDCHAESPDEIFGNMTYMIGNEYYADKVKLAGGKREVLRYLYVYYEDKYVYGDFNNDGLRDAAVIIAESGGGSGHFRELAFLINDGTQFVHEASCYLGDKVIIDSLKEQKGKVIVEMLVRDESRWAEAVMKRVKNTYEYSGPQAWGEGLDLPDKDIQVFLNADEDSQKLSIADLYESGIVDEIKRNLIYSSMAIGKCSNCRVPEPPLLNSQEIIEYKFLVIEQISESGGVENVYIAIDSNPMRYFRLSMYPEGAGTYQMRFLKEVTVMAQEEFFIYLRTGLKGLWEDF